jgi:hypothetical protein
MKRPAWGGGGSGGGVGLKLSVYTYFRKDLIRVVNSGSDKHKSFRSLLLVDLAAFYFSIVLSTLSCEYQCQLRCKI